MKKMAQARLQESIDELEVTLSTAKQQEQPNMILIVDCHSLLYYLPQVKEIKSLEKHHVVVPQIGNDDNIIMENYLKTF